MLFRLCLINAIFVSLLVPQEAPEATFRTSVKVVVAPTVVTDRNGSFVDGLRPEDFKLTDNQKPQNIKVDISYVPISMVVAVQANSFMEPLLPTIKKVGSLFHGSVVGEEGEVAIVSFDHRVEVKQNFTSSADQIEDALQSIKPGSQSSRMIDAVLLSARLLEKRPENRRRVILLISESRDNGSEARLRDALTAAQMANISIYPVNINRLSTSLKRKPDVPRPDPMPPGARPLPPGVPLTPGGASQVTGNNPGNFVPLFVEIFRGAKGLFVDNPSEVLAAWSGGKEHSFGNLRDLESAVSDIGHELHAQYLISYSPSNRDEGGFHDIQVFVNRPEIRDIRVRTRRGYWIAAMTP